MTMYLCAEIIKTLPGAVFLLLPSIQFIHIKFLLESKTHSFLFHQQLFTDNPNEAYE